MLKKLRVKWFVLAAAVGVLPAGLGQCISDIIEDAIIFSAVN
jgi:hypothetical protein